MNGPNFERLVEQQFEECRALLTSKGPDYSDEADRLSNFKLVAALTGLTPEQVWSVYAAKHFIAIMKYCGKGKLESEPITGRISDLINYGGLLRGLVEERV